MKLYSLIKMEVIEYLKLLRDLAFPLGGTCILCKAELSQYDLYGLCETCIEKMAFLSESEIEHCRICGKLLGNYYGLDLCINCNSGNYYFDKGYMITSYNPYSRKLLFDLKYKDKRFIAIHFGQMIYDRLSYEEVMEEIDLITSVPIHKKRLRSRGFNQAQFIATEVGQSSGVEYDDVLTRHINTLSQNKIGKDDRESNVSNAFSIDKNKKNKIRGKKVLLIDDIYTTGATMNACAKVLKEHGVSQVIVSAISAGDN